MCIRDSFLPSIAEASSNLKLVNELISKQVELALLLSVPLIILMIGYSPLILELLYTKEFSEAQNLLKILLFADIIKVVSFPIGFAILGLGDSDAVKRQGPTQLMLLVALVYFFLPILGGPKSRKNIFPIGGRIKNHRYSNL